MEEQKLKNILEAILMSAGKPILAEKLLHHFDEEDPRPSITVLRKQLKSLQADCDGRGIELKEVSSGYRYQALCILPALILPVRAALAAARPSDAGLRRLITWLVSRLWVTSRVPFE